ncbi:MAG: phospho-N-acetylmuramoyl-pentapeptide-transferase [Candidatus Eremiobacteraeota bacterium]|nr:phospho-N-acetylmuramoyl-pentapeptide-transferase [Candidatus Eremiobacteraeota bacterium]
MTLTLIFCFVGGVVVCAALVPLLIARQRRQQTGQQIYEDAPKSHSVKQGTPTLGGLAFAGAAVAGFVISGAGTRDLPLLCLVLVSAAIGFTDDMLILRARRSLGLRARAKFILIAIAAVLYVMWLNRIDPQSPTQTWFGGTIVLTHAAWVVLSVLGIVGAANAVNLTDGLDGLATGTVIPTLFVLQLPLRGGASSPSGMGVAVLGACVAFLWFNRHPARIFMGDTGSLALGALLAGLAIQSHELLLLPFFGAIFVFEALSVILQVASFKTLRRRIFRMSPLHHHFELGGWRETAVTTTFVLVQTLCAAATWLAAWASSGRGAVS